MAITKTQKQPRGHEVQKTRFRDMGTEASFPLETYAAYWLPVLEEDKVHDLWWVVLAGQFVALDKTSINSGVYDNGREVVLANGGAAQNVVYAADDVTARILDIDQLNSGSETLVTAAKTATKQVASNFPLGVAPYNFYTKATEKSHFNVFPQPNITFVNTGMYELPLLYDSTDGAVGVAATNDQGSSGTNGAIGTGNLIRSGALGWPVRWGTSESVEQICGRCIRRITIAVDDSLDLVHTVPGLSLPGTGTSGRQLHEDFTLIGDSTKYAVSKARIILMLG
jgi:hypothetical protein